MKIKKSQLTRELLESYAGKKSEGHIIRQHNVRGNFDSRNGDRKRVHYSKAENVHDRKPLFPPVAH